MQRATMISLAAWWVLVAIFDPCSLRTRQIGSNLPAKGERAGKAEQLRTLPRLRSAARNVASATDIVMNAPQATEDRLLSLAEVENEIERMVPREKVTAAVATIVAWRGAGQAVPDAAATHRAAEGVRPDWAGGRANASKSTVGRPSARPARYALAAASARTGTLDRRRGRFGVR
ncbi:hypothetical protein ACIBF1_30040 [Spirillospora sp. NPDC050679]